MTCPTVCQPDCDATCHESHFAAPDRRHDPSTCRSAADRLVHEPTPPRVPPAGDRGELIGHIREQIKAAKAALQPPVTKAGRQEEA